MTNKNCPSIFFAKTSHIQQTNWTILIPRARNDRKSLLILIRTTTYCFSEKTFLFTVACVSFQKFVESISPYRMYYSKQKQNILSIPDDNILCSVLNFRGNIKILLFLFAPMINRK